MSQQEAVYVLVGEDDGEWVEALFTGPEAKERSEEAMRLKSMAAEAKGDPDPMYRVKTFLSNPSNEQMGLGASLTEVATDPFVHAAIASIFTKGQAIVPSWLNVEWLRYEVSKATNEDIKADGQILKIATVQRVSFGAYDPERDAGFVESNR